MEPNINVFSHDARENSGYLYTTNAPLSARLANARITDVTLEVCNFAGKRILDLGCGDGTYSMELFERGKPTFLIGCDPADGAIVAARQKVLGQPVTFDVSDAYRLPYSADNFDIAHLRGVLHHMERPFAALQEALRVAPQIIIIEPNGYNPVLKLIERFSAYHRAHEEKSYPAHKLDEWICRAGGEVIERRWVGLVPFFSPDWFARFLKVLEPVVERIPLLRAVACGVYVCVARRRRREG